MDLHLHIAKHLREVFFGGNWTWSNLKEQLSDVTWKESTREINDLNTIATLTFHIHYFIAVQLKVLQGGPLVGKDSESFAHPPIRSSEDWEKMKNAIWQDVEALASEVQKLDDQRFGDIFCEEKYGTYYRNLHGLIEHSHYHLGQISLIKKLLRQ